MINRTDRQVDIDFCTFYFYIQTVTILVYYQHRLLEAHNNGIFPALFE